MFLSDVCLSRTSGLSWEQRGLGRTKLEQRYPTSHVTQIPLSRSKGQGHQTPGHFTRCSLNTRGRCSSDRENVLDVGTTATLRLLSGTRGSWAPTGGGEGRGISCRHVHRLLCIKVWWYHLSLYLTVYCKIESQIKDNIYIPLSAGVNQPLLVARLMAWNFCQKCMWPVTQRCHVLDSNRNHFLRELIYMAYWRLQQ